MHNSILNIFEITVKNCDTYEMIRIWALTLNIG